MVIIMLSKDCNKKLYLFSILVLLLWSTFSGVSSTSEITDFVCSQQYSYVNRSVSSITPAAKHIPIQEYLSNQYSGTQETVSVARNRSVRLLSRTVRHITAGLFYGGFCAASFAVLGQLSYQQVPTFCLCGIIITNYIHQKDGRKSRFLFTQL